MRSEACSNLTCRDGTLAPLGGSAMLRRLDDWRAFEAVGRLLERYPWFFADEQAQSSHQYTLRRQWDAHEPGCGDADFARVVGQVRAQLDVNERSYWTGGTQNGPAMVINRRLLERAVDYDAIAPVYDSLFVDAESRSENLALMELLGDVSKRSVLDIGAGTGLLLDHQAIDRYTGIDPSRAMLEQLQKKHPGANVRRTPLNSFVGGAYDVVVALFGTASYLSEEEIERVPTLLNADGRYFLMFYAPGYFPEVYRRSRHPPAPDLSLSSPREGYRTWRSYRILEGGPHDTPCIERLPRVLRG
jgi:SAM-dependent methyltransferase